MRASFVWLWWIPFVAGCAATTENAQPFASRSLWKKPTPAEEKKENDTKTAAADKPEKTDNPFRKASDKSSLETPKTEVAAKEARKPETPAAAANTEPTTDKTSSTSFHAETLRVINTELADASAEERAFWYDQLKQVDPAVIPQILQARRLTAQIVEQRQQDVAPAAEKAADRDAWSQEASTSRSPRNGRQSAPIEDSAVMQASGRQIPGSRADLNFALQESDGFSLRPQIEQQGYTVPNPAPEKPVYAVQQQSTETATPSPATAPTKSNSPASRMGLSRLLPSGRTGAVAQTSANSPSPVSLMPPAELAAAPNSAAQLESLISQLESEVAQLKPGNSETEQTDYIQRHVHLRMLYLMAQHPERALTAIPGIDSADQEFWQQTLWGMTNYFDAEHLPAAKDRAGQAVAQLAAATQRLRERADLEIRNLAFCREIAYYGNFVRFPRDEFRPGDDLLLYAEIDNFKSELTVDGQYRTLLRSTVEILSPSGEVRWHKEFPATEDLCVNYRRDYFHNYQFAIPDQIPLGPHTLKLTVFDELSNKVVSQSINFIVR